MPTSPARACGSGASGPRGPRRSWLPSSSAAGCSRVATGERMASSSDVYNAFWPWMIAEKIEVFCCAMVDAKLRLIRTEVISRGTLTASIVHPREAFRPAVRNAASGVIFAHNHPSGDPVPSEEDRRITGRLEEVGPHTGHPAARPRDNGGRQRLLQLRGRRRPRAAGLGLPWYGIALERTRRLRVQGLRTGSDIEQSARRWPGPCRSRPASQGPVQPVVPAPQRRGPRGGRVDIRLGRPGACGARVL